jgi:hypothetical protein
MTFDLGVRGDYEGMYAFLDAHEAKECGDSAAYFDYEFSDNLIGDLMDEIKQCVALDKRSRVYVVFPIPGEKGGYKGRFIFGRRKAPPWAGYGTADVGEEDVGE